MNFLKTKKIMILVLASYASALCAAAYQERSLLQRTKDFVAEHPIATGLIGTAAAAGIYELAAHKFGLPTLSGAGFKLDQLMKDHAKKEFELILSDKLGFAGLSLLVGGGTIAGVKYVSQVAQARHGEYPEVVKTVCDFADEHPIGAVAVAGALGTGLTLGYEMARLNGLPPLSDNLLKAGAAFVEQIKKDLICGAAPSEDAPSIKDHVLHAVRLYGYRQLLHVALFYIGVATSTEAAIQSSVNDSEASMDLMEDIPWYAATLVQPLLEEALLTHLPNKMLGNKAQFIAPILFGLIHSHYDRFGKIKIGTMNLVNHRSLIARPEYQYAPIMSHVLNNTIAYLVMKLFYRS